MQFHEIRRRNPNKKPKPRIGQGGKRGTTSGRGQKGQKSRSGHRIRPAERDLIQRLPKLRGHGNKRNSEKVAVFNVGDLQKILPEGGEISATTLGRAGKLLAKGEVKAVYTISGLSVSASARKKIEAAGGKIV